MSPELQALARRTLAAGLEVEETMRCHTIEHGAVIVVDVCDGEVAAWTSQGSARTLYTRDLLPDLSHPGTAGLAVAQLERRWFGVDVETLRDKRRGCVVIGFAIDLRVAAGIREAVVASTRAEAIAAAFEVKT